MSENSNGTPQTLDEAIRHALCVGPLSEIHERAYFVLRDYLANRFSSYYLMAQGH